VARPKMAIRQTERLFRQDGIKMSDFAQPTVLGYSEWPKHSPNYGRCRRWVMRWAGLIARTGSPKPELRQEFKSKYGHELVPPKSWTSSCRLRSFPEPSHRWQEGLRRLIFTERGSEGITMGVTNVMYDYGFDYDNPKKPYEMNDL